MTQCNNKVMFETLESRTMMSAAPVVHAVAVHTVAATKVVAKPAAKATLPAIVANPALNDSTLKYTNFSNAPLFASNGPSINDVQQGDLGDCYFLSTLSAIAKINSSVIRKDIISNNDGTFTVDFTKAGKVTPIRVNADLPTTADGQLAYAGFGAGHSVWVAILEKAFADFRSSAKSYDSLNGGWMGEVFSDLGIKSQGTYATASAAAMGKLMAADVKAKDAITFATGDTITDNASLIADHAYELDSVTVDSKGNVLTIRLRNPWGVDGVGNDGSNDGYVTVTVKQAFENMSGMVAAKV